jgi:myo-inositol catabolism protein IolS
VEKRKLGRSGIEVSVLAMGCWALGGESGWGDQEDSLSIATIHAALDRGVNFFDTAEAYGDGHSEEVVGKALADRRDKAIVGTKISPPHTAPAVLRKYCEASLRRLQTDYIDLYMIHWPVRTHAVADSLAVLDQLKQEGKIRAIGVSNFGVQDLGEALGAGVQIDVNQLCYSLLARGIEFEILPLCQEHQISVTAYMPLLQGILADKYRAADEVPPFRARTRHFSAERGAARHGEGGFEQETFAALDAIREIAQELGQPMANVALSWAIGRPGVSSVLAGARTPAQIERNVKAAALALAPEVIARLDEVTREVKDLVGSHADLWESVERSRSR